VGVQHEIFDSNILLTQAKNIENEVKTSIGVEMWRFILRNMVGLLFSENEANQMTEDYLEVLKYGSHRDEKIYSLSHGTLLLLSGIFILFGFAVYNFLLCILLFSVALFYFVLRILLVFFHQRNLKILQEILDENHNMDNLIRKALRIIQRSQLVNIGFKM
jgi:hypothetical protein